MIYRQIVEQLYAMHSSLCGVDTIYDLRYMIYDLWFILMVYELWSVSYDSTQERGIGGWHARPHLFHARDEAPALRRVHPQLLYAHIQPGPGDSAGVKNNLRNS